AATTCSRVAEKPSRAAGRSGARQLSLLKLWLTQAGSGRLSSTSSPRQTGLKVLGAGLEMRGAGSGAAFTTGKNSGAAATASTPTARPILIHIRSANPSDPSKSQAYGLANWLGFASQKQFSRRASVAAVQGTVFFRRDRAFPIGADVQPLVVQRIPLPVGHAHLGTQQPAVGLPLGRAAIGCVGIVRVFLHIPQGRQGRRNCCVQQ